MSGLAWASVLVPAITSIAVALITSGAVLRGTTVDVAENRSVKANVEYVADSPGFVTAFAVGSADPDKKRRVVMNGFIDDRKVLSTVAADDTVGISIAATSISMPINKGVRWKIETDVEQQVTVTLFTARPEGWFWSLVR